MALNELLIGFRKAAVRSALGLVLLAPVGYGCGDTVENNYYGDGSGNGGSYTCEEACDNITKICRPVDEMCVNASPGSSCWDDYSYASCLSDCKSEPWPQAVINCWAEECDGEYCH